MTGKELIVYILENDLVNEEMVKDGVPIWLMSVGEAAFKFNVGVFTVNTWAINEQIEYEVINGQTYIYKNAKDPRD